MSQIIIYDFDGTLTNLSVPKYKVKDKEIDVLNIVKNRIDENIDIYHTFYNTYFQEFKKLNCKITDEILCSGSKDIEYSNGVEKCLETLCRKGIKNYIISSGLKVYLENTKIAKYFTRIYGTTLKYKNDEVIGIDYMMTDKDKVSVIKEIISSNKLNNCSNVIYIGDGLTDMEAFKYVHENGGISIFVYDDYDNYNKQQFIDYSLRRDYTEDSELYSILIVNNR